MEGKEENQVPKVAMTQSGDVTSDGSDEIIVHHMYPDNNLSVYLGDTFIYKINSESKIVIEKNYKEV